MNVALMQPYLFPYIGYFQLMAAVDLFILYDDVQWIKGGWIHRNRILERGQPAYLTFPVAPAPFPSLIKDRVFDERLEDFQRATLARLAEAYRGAPQRDAGLALVERCFATGERAVVPYTRHVLATCAEHLGIATPMVLSSVLPQTPGLHGQDRVIDIVGRAGAKRYVNSIGGQALYDARSFAERGIELQFLAARPERYAQLGDGFVPFLSIIDVAMCCDAGQMRQLLAAQELIAPAGAAPAEPTGCPLSLSC